MKRQWLLTAIAVTGLAMASPAALAKKHRTISEEEAAMIANSMIGGRVVDVDYEKRKHGRSYYEVEIRKDGRTYEVYVDAKTGQLLDMGGERDRDRDEIEVYPDYHNGTVMTRMAITVTTAITDMAKVITKMTAMMMTMTESFSRIKNRAPARFFNVFLIKHARPQIRNRVVKCGTRRWPTSSSKEKHLHPVNF